MGIVKSLIGSLIGAAVGVGIYYGIKQSTEQTYIWFPLVIGVLTGIAARLFAGSLISDSGRFVSGAVAGLIAAAAILGIDFLPTLLAKPNEFGPIELKDRMKFDAPLKQDDKVDLKADQDAADDSDKVKSDGEERSDDRQEPSDDAPDVAANDDEGNATDQVEQGDVNDQGDDDSSQENDRNADEGDAGKIVSSRPGDSTNPESRDQSRSAQNVPNNSDANTKRFADLIKKQSHQSWYNFVMPHVFTGLGILVAYQIARGFGSGKPKS